MATLQLINYHPFRVNIQSNKVHWAKSNHQIIKGLPQIIWQDNTTWSEANLWALEQAISFRSSIKTVRSNMSHLLAYAKWLESESMDWWHFPDRESERCLNRFRGALIQARNSGELAPSTTSQRMAAVIRFYKWAKNTGLISTEWPMWKDKLVGIKLTNQFGLEHTLKVASTNLAIPNRTVAGPIQLEDGLLPVAVKAMRDILSFADENASTELALMLRIGFFTGLRIGSITDLKVSTLQNAITVPEIGIKTISVGPSARPPVETKFDASGSVPIPNELLEALLDYASSIRRLKRQALSPEADQDLLFLTRFGNNYKGDSSSAINVEMSRLRKLGLKSGVKAFRGFYFHRTRATYATELMRVALDAMSVSDAIEFVKGSCLHKDESTTMKYVKFIETSKTMKEASDAFTEAFMGLSRNITND
ncbi:tyrosine-type recombinase/integrase [Psychrobacter sp. 4Bb]|uniref:tyrosine-type recombinase/integrase n=1 Tax=Psychrobacter sp. 4Bb TaxID=888436 RepID=UPI000C7A5724|nr:site-specific integrase [Psychrobacter sp. 4Bb]PKH79998.1 integrase [Psychrobacter sp. 4Bb]